MGSSSYYDRVGSIHPFDRGIVFATPEDEAAENEVRLFVEREWECQLHKFGKLTPVDWYALRHDHLVAVLEFKARSEPKDKYPTVFLNLRKWLALTMASLGFDIPAFFVVKWTDGLAWINLKDVDANHANIKYLGCRSIVKSASDREPVILIPSSRFTTFTTWNDE